MDVYLNGVFMDAASASISPMDRGFLFADGVYEVVPAFNGVLFGFDAHLSRLQRSLAALRIPDPQAGSGWRPLFEALLERNGGGDLAVYLQITRGSPPSRDQAFPQPAVAATVFMTTYPLARSAIHSAADPEGAAAILTEDVRWGRCDIKSVALLANVLCRQQAVDAGAEEAIQVRDGLVTEGSSTNVFMAANGTIVTPPRGHRILSGVTRQIVIDLCRDGGLPIREAEVSREELLRADEIWITSSSKDALPIVTLDGRPVGSGEPGPLWREVARRFVEHKRSVCGITAA